jgi:hypothetical protein
LSWNIYQEEKIKVVIHLLGKLVLGSQRSLLKGKSIHPSARYLFRMEMQNNVCTVFLSMIVWIKASSIQGFDDLF